MTKKSTEKEGSLPCAYLLGASCVAFNEIGRVLIVCRRDPKRWELPGGFLNPHEAFQDAVARETLEETGVLVEVHGLVAVYQHPSRGILAGVFIATAFSGEPRPTPEASMAEWVEVVSALERLDPLYRPRLEDVLEARNSATFRVHEGTETLTLLAAQCIRGFSQQPASGAQLVSRRATECQVPGVGQESEDSIDQLWAQRAERPGRVHRAREQG